MSTGLGFDFLNPMADRGDHSVKNLLRKLLRRRYYLPKVYRIERDRFLIQEKTRDNEPVLKFEQGIDL